MPKRSTSKKKAAEPEEETDMEDKEENTVEDLSLIHICLHNLILEEKMKKKTQLSFILNNLY